MINIRKLIWASRYKCAVRKADRLAKASGRRYYVLLFAGRLKVIPKQAMKHLVMSGRFRKGVTIRDIESKALHVTK